jgi:hypothetical protein
MAFSSSRDLTGELLELDNYELRRFQRSEANENVNDSVVDVVLSGGLAVALHEVSVTRFASLERSFSK